MNETLSEDTEQHALLAQSVAKSWSNKFCDKNQQLLNLHFPPSRAFCKLVPLFLKKGYSFLQDIIDFLC